MSDASKHERALKVFQTLCDELDKRQWKYERIDDELVVRFGLYTEDLPVHIIFIVDEERQLLRLGSPMAFKMNEAHRVDGSIITNVASMFLRDGNFGYDPYTGGIVFHLTVSFLDSEIGPGLIQYFVSCTHAVVDHYNDKFEAVNNGKMTVQEFISGEV